MIIDFDGSETKDFKIVVRMRPDFDRATTHTVSAAVPANGGLVFSSS